MVLLDSFCGGVNQLYVALFFEALWCRRRPSGRQAVEGYPGTKHHELRALVVREPVECCMYFGLLSLPPPPLVIATPLSKLQ